MKLVLKKQVNLEQLLIQAGKQGLSPKEASEKCGVHVDAVKLSLNELHDSRKCGFSYGAYVHVSFLTSNEIRFNLGAKKL